MSTAHHADADETEVDAIVGPLARSVLCLDLRAKERGDCDSGGGRSQELTALDRGAGFHGEYHFS
jgi:hypothetical protein